MESESTIIQPQSINALLPKMQLQGTVKETQLYGALIDIGVGVDGMAHISQLARGRTNRVTDVVQPGDTVTVWVTQVDAEKGRIGLTMVEPPDVTWDELAEGQTYTGTISRIEKYGVFVEIGAERAGLLHVREMASGYVRHPSDLVQIGDEIEVRINKLDRRRHRIDLTMADGMDEIENDVNEEPMLTAMEVALQRAQLEQRSHERRPQRRRRTASNLSEREDILSRTLRQHSGR